MKMASCVQIFLLGLAISAAVIECSLDFPEARILRDNASDTGSLCIPESGADEEVRENFTATCVAPTDVSVVWVIGDYQMVDRDQFMGSVFGVFIEDNTANLSRLNLYDEGAEFIRDLSATDIINISCQSVTDEVNVRRSPDILTFYVGLEPVAPTDPTVSVTSCNNDGTLSLNIKYESLYNCSGSVLYHLSGNCSRQDQQEPTFNGCSAGPIGTFNISYNAISGNIARNQTRSLDDNLTCNQATWKLCNGTVYVVPNMPSGSEGWNYTSVNDGERICVYDVTPSGVTGTRCRVARYDDNINCDDQPPPPTSPPTPEPGIVEQAWFVAVMGVVSVIAGLGTGVIIGIPIMMCYNKKKSKRSGSVPISVTNTQFADKTGASSHVELSETKQRF